MKTTDILKLFLISTFLFSCSDEASTTTSDGGTMESINGVSIKDKAAIEESLQKNKAAGKSTMSVVIRNPDGSTKTVEMPSPHSMQ